MKKCIIYIVFMLGIIVHGHAQLPPVFGPEYQSKTQKDELTRMYITPQRIVWQHDGNGEYVKDAEHLLKPGNGQGELSLRAFCRMKTTEQDTASILLDFGKELHGGLQMVLGSSSDGSPSLIRIRFGESVGECNSVTTRKGIGYSTDDHAKRDILVEIPRDGNFEIGNTGFRFVRIDLLDHKSIQVKEVRAIFRYRDIPYLGSFRCNDERLNQIWMTGAYTVHLNMQEFLWDGIKRDRLVWLGDMHPEISTILSVFGCNGIVPASLDYACRQYLLPKWMNGIPSYSLWYLIIQSQWYLHSGDLNYLQSQCNYITGLIDLIEQKLRENRNEGLGGWEFLDWPSSPNKAGVSAGVQALTIWAMQEAVKMCALLEEPNHVKKAKDIISRIKKQVKEPNGLKQAAALMAIAGLVEPETACREVVSVDGAKHFSTFYGYYMLQAQALAGRYQEALDIIRQYWGAMLDLGATTFWEDFNLDWLDNVGRIDELLPEGKKDIHGDFGAYCYPGFRHSLCHGWASGPTAWMTQHVLGVKVLKPGCKELEISPHLGDLEWVEGTFPTPQGVVTIKHVRGTDGKVYSEVNAPAGVKVIVK